MPLFVFVEGVKGSLVAHPSGSASEGQPPRYLGLRHISRPAEEQGSRDVRKVFDRFELVRELVEVNRADHLRIRRAAADGEIRLLGECDASTRAAAELKLHPPAKAESPRKRSD